MKTESSSSRKVTDKLKLVIMYNTLHGNSQLTLQVKISNPCPNWWSITVPALHRWAFSGDCWKTYIIKNQLQVLSETTEQYDYNSVHCSSYTVFQMNIPLFIFWTTRSDINQF